MCRHKYSRLYRQAVSLVEVLIVTAIIAILVAPTFVGMQRVRESAAQARCRNKLRQMGLAWANHAATIGHYPTNGTHWASRTPSCFLPPG